jgi:hypothetical protein
MMTPAEKLLCFVNFASAIDAQARIEAQLPLEDKIRAATNPGKPCE